MEIEGGEEEERFGLIFGTDDEVRNPGPARDEVQVDIPDGYGPCQPIFQPPVDEHANHFG